VDDDLVRHPHGRNERMTRVVRRGVSAALKKLITPLAAQPNCRCHGRPMQWHRDAGRSNGGFWRCAVRLHYLAIIDTESLGRGDACQVCGATKNLHWHHPDPATKLFAIGDRAPNRAALLAELAKCDLLCAACHCAEHVRMRAAAAEADR
jgi:hypothetical protein